MSMCKLAAVILSAVITAASLTSCGKASQSSTAQSGASQSSPTAYDTGVFTVSAPQGWCAAPAPDTLKEYDGKTNPNQVYVIKNGKPLSGILLSTTYLRYKNGYLKQRKKVTIEKLIDYADY